MTQAGDAHLAIPQFANMSDFEHKPLLAKHVVHEPPVDLNSELWQLTSMALQVSLSTFARIALESIDSAFLGHIGAEALAASSLAIVWTNVPLMGVWAGASALVTLCGQAWGAKNGELAGIWLQMGLVITSILMIPVFIWYWCLGFVLGASTDDQEVVTLGIRFARILSFSIWPSLVYACVRLYFQSVGIMAPTTVVGTISIGVTVAANYILIYGAFGWGGMGFDGSPLATVIASWFQPIALISYAVVYKKMHLQAWGGWDFKAFTPERIKTFLGIAIPVASNSLVSNLANSAMSLIAAKLGSDVIAANAVISGLWGLLWALFWGFGCATQVRVANHLGANRPAAAKKLGLLGFGCTVICVVLLAIGASILRHRLFYVFTTDDDLLNLCMLVQPIFICGFMIESMEILTSSILTAMGEVNVTAWACLLATWVIELPIAYVGAIVLGYGFPMLWYAICIMETVKILVYLYTLSKIDWNAMARRAVETMEATGENEEEVLEDTKNVAISEAGNVPIGLTRVMHSPVNAPLLTPTSRAERWDRDTGGLTHHRGSVSFVSPSGERSGSFHHV
ncbi:hypothetical protein Poli38472_009364 [Pythium oligandrum]|uniref:Multidrug and toxic compound extrusion protein n=1 Tax=Pythium oligandrum TaxID=41045 RepID=A0A8K1CKL2_PYTOL|nr:hypothetical protein Poli38472_009364 [Pythium oligandrum]|eukprot:TMW65197.1 hypothetical protein Poli38472_009364 [Pythium oligandrum]